MSRTAPETLTPSSASRLRRVVATIAAAATVTGAAGLAAASPAFAATGGFTFTPTSKANTASPFTLSGTSSGGTLYNNTSTLTLTGPDAATFTSNAAANAAPSATLSVTANLTTLDAGTYTVSTSGVLGGTDTGATTFTITGAADALTAFTIHQNTGADAAQIGVGSTARTFRLTGSNFTRGTTLTALKADGTAATGVTVATTSTAVGEIDGTISAAGAAAGAYTIVATQPLQDSTLTTDTGAKTTKQTLPFTVNAAPTITSGTSTDPAPSTGQSSARVPAGETKTVTFTGTGFTGSTTLTTATTGVSIGTTTDTSATTVSAPVAVVAGTAAENVAVVATNNDGGTSTSGVTSAPTAVLRTLAARPTVTSTSPTLTAGAHQTTLTVTGTGFTTGAPVPAVTFPDANGDITVDGTVTATSATSLTVPVDVVAKPSKTSYAVTVTDKDPSGSTTTADGPAGTCATPCVTVSSFTLTSSSPTAVGNVGSTAVTVNGNNFVAGDTYSIVLTPPAGDTAQQPIVTTVPAAGVTASSNGAGGSLKAPVNFDGVEGGSYTVGIATSDGRSATCSTCSLQVNDGAPAPTSVTPKTLVPGQKATLTISGTGFTNGSTVSTSGTDLTFGKTTLVSSTTITVPVTASTTAATTTTNVHSLTITTPDNQAGTLTNAVTVVAGPTLALTVPTAVTAGGPTPAATNGSVAVTNPAGGETFDGAPGDGGQLAVTLTITGPAGLSASALHVTYGAAKTPVAFTDVSGGGVTGSFPATSYAAGATTTTPYTLTLDSGVAAGMLTVGAVLTETGTGNTYSARSGTTTVETEPGAPTITTVDAGRQQLVINYTAPASDGGLAITGYRATVTASGGSPQYFAAGASATSITATGLTGGTTYTVTVAASNDPTPTNYGPESASSPGTPYDLPGVPANVTATAGGTDKTAAISWTPPAANGSPITDYLVTATDTTTMTTLAPVDTASAKTTYSYGGLTDGDSYTFTVTAVNAAGKGAPSAASNAVTPSTVPGQPAAPSVVAGDMQVVVSFTAPAAGGSAINDYLVTAVPASGTAVTRDTGSTDTSYTFTGLANGTAYTFTVAAKNTSGTSSASSPSAAVTPAGRPGAPTKVSATPLDGQASVTWTAPTVTNGAPITDYVVTAAPASGPTVTKDTGSTSTTYTFTGLTNGTAYTFTVTASNAAPAPVSTGTGTGPASAPSSAVTPQPVPTAPMNVAATAGNASATVTWTAVTATAPVSDYVVTATSAAGGATILDTMSTNTSYTFMGLTNGTSYTFTVVAKNASGASAASAASNAVTPATVPGAPTGVTATPGNGSAVVSWTAPTVTGGSPVTDYAVTATDVTSGVVGSPIDTKSTATSYTVTGLTNGDSYTFTVTASNAAPAPVASTTGSGPASGPSTAVMPATVPGAPTGVSATPGNASVTVTWTAPADNGGSAITDYSVTATDTTSGVVGSPVDTKSTATSYTVTGLTNGDSYTFTVTAGNSVGTGAASAASAAVTPATVPGAPTKVSATPGNTSATVTWTAPADNGGSAITDYSVTAIPSAGAAIVKDTASTNTSYLFMGLSNGTSYTFTVTASNAAPAPVASTTGSGPASAASSAVTPATVPGAPTGVSATAGSAQVTVTWSAPVSDGGSAVTDYLVTAIPSSGSPVTKDTGATSLSYVFAGLANGTSYTFTVTARNAVGDGTPSTASAAVTPTTTPGAPTNVTVTGGSTQVTVSWTAPADNGGSTVTDYSVTATPSTGAPLTRDTMSATTTPYVFMGLTNGTSYTFTVTATNAKGAGSPSAPSQPVTPATLPSAPTNVAASVAGTTATVTWSTPTTTGGSAITSYTVTASSGQVVTVTEPAGGTTATFTGLTYGTSYTFTVRATNAAGSGPASAASNAVVPAGLPAAPAAPTVTAADGTITATFTAPANNGSAITSYTAVATPVNGGASITHTSAQSPITITGLANGVTYVVRIYATNAIGNGPASPASAQVTPVAPVAPVTQPTGPVVVTLAESRTFTTYGQQATLFGVVTQGGVVAPNAPVTLTVTYTDGKVVRLGVATSGANGGYSLKYTPIYNGTIVATALGGKSRGVLAKVVVIFTKVTATVRGGRVTISASTAPGFLTGTNRKERVQILLVDSHGRQVKVLGIVNAAQRHGAAGQAHGVNDITFMTTALAAGSYRIEVKVIGTPVNTGAASRAIPVRVS